MDEIEYNSVFESRLIGMMIVAVTKIKTKTKIRMMMVRIMIIIKKMTVSVIIGTI